MLLRKADRFLCSRVVAIPPIIVVGAFRSGTTLLTQLLERCGVMMGNRQTGNSESVFFQEINRNALDLLGCGWRCINLLPDTIKLHKHYQFIHNSINEDVKNKLVSGHLGLSAFKLLLSSQRRWGWKDPRTSLTLPFWQKIFPQATIVHVYRDGRDVALSLLEREKKRERDENFRSQQETETRFLAYLAVWGGYIRRIQAGMNLFEKGYTLQYERLLADPVEQMEGLVHGVELPEPEDLDAVVSIVDKTRSGRHLKADYSWVGSMEIDKTVLHELDYD